MGVRISAGIPTAVLSSFAENTTGSSLASSTTIGDNTRMVLIKGSDVFAIDDENYKKIADVLRRDGLIAFETPSAEDLLGFIAKLLLIESEYQKEFIEENYIFGPDADPVADATAALSASYDARMSTMRGIATKAGINSLSEVMAEMVIMSNPEYFFQELGGGDIHLGTTTIDEKGEMSKPKMEHITIERTPYYCGEMADAAASWLNGLDKMRARTKDMSRHIATKAASIRMIGILFIACSLPYHVCSSGSNPL